MKVCEKKNWILTCLLGNWDEWKGPSEDTAGYNGVGEAEYYEPNVDDPDFNVSRTIHSHLRKEYLVNIFLKFDSNIYKFLAPCPDGYRGYSNFLEWIWHLIHRVKWKYTFFLSHDEKCHIYVKTFFLFYHIIFKIVTEVLHLWCHTWSQMTSYLWWHCIMYWSFQHWNHRNTQAGIKQNIFTKVFLLIQLRWIQ